MKVLEGYIENWNDVEWSGKGDLCEGGCFIPSSFIQVTAPFTSINYAFILTSENWYSGYDPSQLCSGFNQCGSDPFKTGSDKACPDINALWPSSSGAQALYWIPRCRGSDVFSPVIDANTTLTNPTPILFSIQDACRMAHQHPSGSKTFQISFGGWSDGSFFQTGYAKQLATLMVNLVLFSFADGLDLDFEHITQLRDQTGYRTQEQRNQQISFIQELVSEIRSQFDSITTQQIQQNIKDFIQWIDQNKSKLSELQYVSHKTHLRSLCVIPPKFTITYTARFNAFIPDSSLIGLSSFPTDAEGIDLASNGLFLGQVDRYNLMCYDQPLPQGTGYVDFITKVLNTTQQSIPAYFQKVILGLQTGEQQGAPGVSGITQGEIDQLLNSFGDAIGGVMFWGINETSPPHPLPSNIGDYRSKFGLGNKFTEQNFPKAGQDGYILGNPYNLPQCSTEHYISLSSTPTAPDPEAYKNTKAWKTTFIVLTLLVALAVVVYLIKVRPYNWMILVGLGVAFVGFLLPAILMKPKASADITSSKYTIDDKGKCIPTPTCPSGDQPCYDSLEECRDANPLYSCQADGSNKVCQYDPTCRQPSDVCFLHCPKDCLPLRSCSPTGECVINPRCKISDEGCGTECPDCSISLRTFSCINGECQEATCQMGTENCYTSDTCEQQCAPPQVHYECVQGQCVESDCVGGEGCYTTRDCQNKCSTFSCLGGKCSPSTCVTGSDNCFASLEACVCPPQPSEGYSCVDGKCSPTHCLSGDNCFQEPTCGGQCSPKIPTYSCLQGDCIQTDCSGGNNCYKTNTCDDQCGTPVQMWSCDSSSHQCVQSRCRGGTNCYPNADTCQQACTTHYSCDGANCISSDCTSGPNCYKNDPTCANRCSNPKYSCSAGICQANPECAGGPNCYDTQEDCDAQCSKATLKWSCFGDTHQCKQINCVPPNCYNTQEDCQSACGTPPSEDKYYCQSQECKVDTIGHCTSFPQDCFTSDTCEDHCTPFRCVGGFCTKDTAFCTDHPQSCYPSSSCGGTCPTCADEEWCKDKQCGTAPCGLVCGQCDQGLECQSGACVKVVCPGICL